MDVAMNQKMAFDAPVSVAECNFISHYMGMSQS